jgi:hypothetical protein
MDPELYGGLELLGPEVVARAEAFAAKLQPALRAELRTLLWAVDTASELRTGRVCDAEAAAVLAPLGISLETWWAAIEALDPPIR